MKNRMKNKNRFACFLFALAGILNACEDDIRYDVTGDPVNRVYINTGSHAVAGNNSFSFSVTHTPAGSFGDPIVVKFPVSCTLGTSSSTQVTLEVDNSLVDAYNAKNKTGYKAVTNGLVELNKASVTIASRELASSDSIIISVPESKFSQLTEAGYVIPVRIAAIGNAQHTEISSNLNTAYLVIRTAVTNCYDQPVAGDMVGDILNRSGWSGTLDVTPSSGTLSRMLDGNTRTYWYVSPAKKCILTVDMAAVQQKVTGIRLHSYGTSYSLTSAVVSTSSDGATWDTQGTAELSTAAAYQYIKFYSPVSARYLRLEITGWRSSSYVIMAEFDAYAEQ